MNIETDDDDTPLCFATTGGMYAYAILCIICIDGHCFWIGYYKIIEMLIENGALVNFRDNHGISPLYQASLYGQFIFEYFFMCAFFYKWLNSQMAIYSNENIWLLYCENNFFFLV